MASAKVSLIASRDPLPATVPKPGEMVRVEGRKGLFLVVRADAASGTADLMQRVKQREIVEQRVPFQLVRTVTEQASRAIQQFLSS